MTLKKFAVTLKIVAAWAILAAFALGMLGGLVSTACLFVRMSMKQPGLLLVFAFIGLGGFGLAKAFEWAAKTLDDF